jgi:hypothetical protein
MYTQGVRPVCEDEAMEDIMEPTLWKKDGWVARVIKNEDDEGWAVEMTRIGDSEAALVAPWTMGRDKKNPKPLDQSAFGTWVKTATEILRRHTAAARERLHRSLSLAGEPGQTLRAELDIAEDEDDPHAVLAVFDDRSDELVRRGRVAPTFKLSASAVLAFVRGGES